MVAGQSATDDDASASDASASDACAVDVVANATADAARHVLWQYWLVHWPVNGNNLLVTAFELLVALGQCITALCSASSCNYGRSSVVIKELSRTGSGHLLNKLSTLVANKGCINYAWTSQRFLCFPLLCSGAHWKGFEGNSLSCVLHMSPLT